MENPRPGVGAWAFSRVQGFGMNRSQLIRSALTATLAALAMQVAAQQALEIVPLRHRTAEQVLPVLRPLLEPGATLTGHGSQLILRASPANLEELRRALDALDRPLRRLQISVRVGDAGEALSEGVEAGARVGSGGTRIDVRAREDRSRWVERVDQRVQVLEGSVAHISTGQATPVAGGLWQTGSGFEAVPRISGDRVIVEIVQQGDSLDRQQRLGTTVSAPLGEWFEVGGAASGERREERGIASRSALRSSDSRRIWLRVDEVRP
jgi:hypothetical protein